jgi:hypothetical protein
MLCLMAKNPPHRTKQGKHVSMSASAHVTNDTDCQYGLGVLFVHGIGQQSQGETLVRWGEVLIDWIRRVDSPPIADTKVRVLAASLGDGQAKPAEAEVEVTINGGRRSWLMTEAWWAEAFATPSYRQLVVWSTKIVPWAIGLHFARRLLSKLKGLWSTSNRVIYQGRTVRWLRLLDKEYLLLLGGSFWLAATLIFWMLLSPILVGVLLLLLVIGLIPIEKLRSFVGAVQQKLAGTIGDSMVLLENPIQSAAMRSRLRHTLQELATRCEKVAIIAHSQGAEIALQTLAETPLIEKSPERDMTLITFGAGVNKLELLRCLGDIDLGKIHSDSNVVDQTIRMWGRLANPWVASSLLLIFLTLSVSIIYASLMSDAIGVRDFWPIAAYFGLIVFCLFPAYI